MNKQPAAVVWLIHSLEVLVLGAVFSFALTLYQSFNAGTLTLQSAGVAAGTLLFAVIGNGLKGIISNANFAQAVSDLRAELAAQHQPSPVVIHNNIPASLSPAPASPPAPVAPVQQFASPQPFPYAPSSTFPQVPAVQVPQ